MFLPGDQVDIAATHFSSFYGGQPGSQGVGVGMDRCTPDLRTDDELTTLEFYTSQYAPPGYTTIPLNTGMPCACGGDNTCPILVCRLKCLATIQAANLSTVEDGVDLGIIREVGGSYWGVGMS